MLQSIFGSVALIVYAVVIAAALGFGGRAERFGAVVLTCSALATILVQDHRYQTYDVGLMAVDVVQLMALFMIARMTGRSWAVVASALTLLGVFVHVAKWLNDDGIDGFPYLSLYALIGYLVLISLAAGTVDAMRGRRTPPS